jgi:hypothetical protein
MTDRPSAVLATPRRIAMLLHMAMVGAVIVMVVALAVLRSTLELPTIPELVAALRIATVGVILVTVLVLRLVRSRIEPPPRSGERDAWWQASLPRALAVWALAEGMGIVGAVFFLLSGDMVVLAVLAAVSLALLVLNRPSVLLGV